jgi:hypothetical protein
MFGPARPDGPRIRSQGYTLIRACHYQAKDFYACLRMLERKSHHLIGPIGIILFTSVNYW